MVRCECGHDEMAHSSTPPYRCQDGMARLEPICQCQCFLEEDGDRLDAEYERQKYEDFMTQYD